MWKLGWQFRGTVHLNDADSDRVVLDRIQTLLEQEWKTISERGANYLNFEGVAGPHWLTFMIYDRGRFWIEQGHGQRRLRYELCSLHAMKLGLFAALVAFVVGLVAENLAAGLCYAAVSFASLYVTNILVAFWRVPSAIRKASAGT
jgi:hypothetical protein